MALLEKRCLIVSARNERNEKLELKFSRLQGEIFRKTLPVSRNYSMLISPPLTIMFRLDLYQFQHVCLLRRPLRDHRISEPETDPESDVESVWNYEAEFERPR